MVLENVNDFKIVNNKTIGQIILINTSNIKLNGLSLDQTLYFFKNNKNIIIEHCNINGSEEGIRFFGTNTNIIIRKNNITGKNAQGIAFDGTSNKILIENNYVKGSNGIEFRSKKENNNLFIINNNIIGTNTAIFLTGNNSNLTWKNDYIKGSEGISFYICDIKSEKKGYDICFEIICGKNKNIEITGNTFNISKEYITLKLPASLKNTHNITENLINLSLDDGKYGNYYGKINGTGYSDICNDTNNDGICDQPFKPIRGFFTGIFGQHFGPLKGFVDHKPLKNSTYYKKKIEIKMQIIYNSENNKTNNETNLGIQKIETYENTSVAVNQTNDISQTEIKTNSNTKINEITNEKHKNNKNPDLSEYLPFVVLILIIIVGIFAYLKLKKHN